MLLPVLFLIGFCTLVAKHGKTDLAAYRAGKEAPSIEKFRKRHAARQKWLDGDRKLTTPSKRGGKEPGPMRKWFRAVRDNAADELIDRQNHKSQARRKWYSDNAPQRETQWQTKWQGKLDKRELKIRRWGQKKGVIDPAPAEPAEPESPAEPTAETPTEKGAQQRGQDEVIQAWRDALERGETDHNVVTSDEWNALPAETRNQLIDEARQAGFGAVTLKDGAMRDLKPDTGSEQHRGPIPDLDSTSPETPKPAPEPAEPTFGTGQSATPAAPTGGSVYEQGVQELTDSAEEVRQFCTDMDSFADGLSGRHYGNEITGLAGEMSNILSGAGDIYADLAEQIQDEGDDVKNAHDSTGHQIPDEAAMA